jgi:molybdopterin molybdotransferase
MARADRLTVTEGLARIRALTPLLGVETIAIGEANARILAETVHARSNVPRFACSAMDGYALRSADTEGASESAPVALALNPPLPAGAAARTLAPGTATPISTGAPIPPGADTVLVRERARIEGDRLRLPAPIAAWTNIRAEGEDVARGAVLGTGGVRLDPERIGMLAAAGIGEVLARRRPRLGYFSTGDELAEGITGSASAIADANRPMIAALAEDAGLPLLDLGHTRDGAADIAAMIEKADGRVDILCSSGGVSGGAFDFVRACIEAMQGEIAFHGLEMRPGKPLLFARLRSGTLYFGLPGNPVAALVGFRFFALEAVRTALGLPPEAGQAILHDEAEGQGPTRFLRVCLDADRDGPPRYDASLDQRSHILSSAARADGWLRADDANGTSTFFPKRSGRLT